MSQYYETKWTGCLKRLQEIRREELQPATQASPKNPSLSTADLRASLAQAFLNYAEVLRELETITSGLTDPQKWLFAEAATRAVVERLTELKRDLVDLNTDTNAIQSDFFNFDRYLEAAKRPIDDQDLFVPSCFRKTPEILAKNVKIEAKLAEFGDPRPEIERTVELLTKPKVSEGLRALIRAERGRQGLMQGVIRKAELLELHQKQQRQKLIAEKGEAEEKSEREESTKIIQAYVRGLCARLEVARMRREEHQLKFASKDAQSEDFAEKAASHFKAKEVKLATARGELKEQRERLRAEILENDAEDIRAAMLDERRKFVLKYFEDHEGKELPKDETIFYLQKEQSAPTPADMEDKKRQAAAKPKPKPAAANGGKKRETEEEAWMKSRDEKGPAKSAALAKLARLSDTFFEAFASKNEPGEAPNFDLLMAEVLPQIQDGIREEVDRRIRSELQALHLKLGIQKKKEPVERKKPKKPEPVEPDFFQPLIEANILKKLEPAKFKDFKGAHNYLRAEVEAQAPGQVDPSLAQLRNAIIENVALPLATGNPESDPKSTAPTQTPAPVAPSGPRKIKSFLFYGPRGTGKSLMLRALVEETGATVLDISAQIVADNFLEKSSATKIIAMVFRAARELQPSVVFMDEVEHLLPKKLAKKFKPR